MIYALAIFAAFMAALAVYSRGRLVEAESEAFDAKGQMMDAQEELARTKDAVRRLTVPLGWAYVLPSVYDHPENVNPMRELRHYLVAIYAEVQDALHADDVQMAEVRDQAAMVDPPRRLPRYPQVPPYLATVEDALGLGVAPATVETAREMAAEYRGLSDRMRAEVKADERQEAATEATLRQVAADVAQEAPEVNRDIEAAQTALERARAAGHPSAEGVSSEAVEYYRVPGFDRVASSWASSWMSSRRSRRTSPPGGGAARNIFPPSDLDLVPDSGAPGRTVLTCEEGHRFEAMLGRDEEVIASIDTAGIECPTCGATLRRAVES